ncbi:hypothetical protein ACFQ1M_16130 [Sungkyunkwania multivorans]|uniref:DUF6630 domain-containing protein n=1 Tax=Sungkyunkwania multivorans TaxID=1173618 RepID=A0ABW3D101_9FLAO
MKRNKSIVELAKLMTEDLFVHQEVLLSINEPEEYVLSFENDLANRGIEKPAANLPWIALVDGLRKRSLLFELDWKANLDDILDTCFELLKEHPEYDEILEDLSLLEDYNIIEDAEESLLFINGILILYGVQVVVIDLNSDSLPLMLLPIYRIEEAMSLANSAGYGALKLYSKGSFHNSFES